MATACYLVNRSPTSALVGKTPMEVWSGKKPSIRHLRVFGCEAYAHVPKEKRSKLENKAVKCIFIGYSVGVKGYKLWDPVACKVLYSRNVIFRELTSSPIVLQPDEKEKKEDIVQFPPTPEKTEQKNHVGSNDEESSSSTDSSEEEEEEEEEQPQPQPLRRSTRVRKQPERFGYSMLDSSCAYALFTNTDEPRSVKEALGMEDAGSWVEAMDDEMASLDKNKTWDLVPLPKGRKPIGSKWVFKKKFCADGSVERYKARLVAKGYSQVEGIDYGEIFSPVAKLTSIRFLLSLAASYDLEIEQMDVKTTFLHGDLEEEIYMSQPEHYIVKGKESWVCRLKKSLYGLKQSPRMWYLKFDAFVLSIGFVRSKSDHCVYFRVQDGRLLIVALYVDDMLLFGKGKGMISDFKSQLSAQFEMKDLGAARYILGMEISRDRSNRKLWLSQSKYVKSVLDRFSMADCRPLCVPVSMGTKLSIDDCPKSPSEMEDMSRVPYASAVGSLMYAMVCTRPDIAQAVGVLSRFMANPGRVHWDAVKRVFRYLRGTSDYSICYHGNSSGTPHSVCIRGFVDSDWAGDVDSRRSTSAYVFTMFGGAISWMSKRQPVVALSTTEAEYMAATHACKEAIWLRRLCSDIGVDAGKITISCDSQSAICLAKNPTFHARTKHIDVQFHFVRDMVEDGKVNLEKVDTAKNVADALTKPVGTEKFRWCSESMGLLAYSG
jgi:hypothetical protein